jgi:hypothetical protein
VKIESDALGLEASPNREISARDESGFFLLLSRIDDVDLRDPRIRFGT